MIRIENVNEVYIRVLCDDPSVSVQLRNHFSFFVEGSQFSPAFRNKKWDGKIYLYNTRNGQLYRGLLNKLLEFAREYDYPVDYPDDHKTPIEPSTFLSLLNPKHTPRDYQISAYEHSMANKRALLLSATGSGKSLISYLLIRRWLLNRDQKILLIVPSVSLVEQMFSDFVEYSENNGWNTQEHVHRIHSGADRETNKPVSLSTWQSLQYMEPSFFAQFTSVLGDECLHPNTNISMADGTKKEISKIVPGELVKTINETTGRIENKPIIKVHRNISINEKMFKISVSNGNVVKITGNHKVMLISGTWVRADELEIGDIISSIE